MTPPLEKEIEKKVCDYAKKRGCIVRKFTSPAHRSVHDRIIVAPGGVVGFLELKRPGQKPTPLQAHEIKLFADQGCNSGWVDNVESGKRFVDNLIKQGQVETRTIPDPYEL